MCEKREKERRTERYERREVGRPLGDATMVKVLRCRRGSCGLCRREGDEEATYDCVWWRGKERGTEGHGRREADRWRAACMCVCLQNRERESEKRGVRGGFTRTTGAGERESRERDG